MKILMVCLGNICRSPLAEGILKHKAQQRGLDWEVESAGTGGWHIGDPPHHGSQNIASKHGIDISTQKGRKFSKEDFDYFDKIYVMDSENYQDVRRIAGKAFDEEKVDLIMNEVYPARNMAVPDPWFANTDAAFEEVYQLLDKATDNIIEKHEESSK